VHPSGKRLIVRDAPAPLQVRIAARARAIADFETESIL